ncbi:RNA polymerase sigma-70 factor (ECF subfamily) [Algoriphagus boseongensis]|uniref:RNA polymerase sigma-70 factor (ECF subfamily) n=1 Tax=Algoriphagus boseongensis TaxID=1442587 RepID=A0A4R6TBS5_9BACT|nr:sigma-70 family RNA polymerase sigma factor [Algoriphagus boseongensis]TDQ19502.1 RNA polymerase sigma-70 factor (ECF subfamily) [Algoriphagus boseongensis]
MSQEEEFVNLIHENQGLIYKISSIYTQNTEEQQDLYQEIVYQTWKSFDRFKGASKTSTWLYRIGMNTAITHLNQRKRKVQLVPMEGLKLDIQDEADPELEERIQVLYRHIRQLNLLDRGIIFLFLEGKSQAEIAEITGISVSNVGTRMSRIKEKLRSEVKA